MSYVIESAFSSILPLHDATRKKRKKKTHLSAPLRTLPQWNASNVNLNFTARHILNVYVYVKSVDNEITRVRALISVY